jgi:hypothetical protein
VELGRKQPERSMVRPKLAAGFVDSAFPQDQHLLAPAKRIHHNRPFLESYIRSPRHFADSFTAFRPRCPCGKGGGRLTPPVPHCYKNQMIRSIARLGVPALVAVMVAGAFLTSCDRQPAQSQVPPPVFNSPPASVPGGVSQVGRHQIVVINNASGGNVVMMLDTVEGATWIYRPPQGAAINGFWTDIPRLTYAPDYWRQVFAQVQQQAQQRLEQTQPAPQPNPVPTPAPAPAPAPAPQGTPEVILPEVE